MSYYLYNAPIPENDGFEVGNVYTQTITSLPASKIYYMAINKKTLVTCRNGKFGKYTLDKEGHSSVAISVSELCEKWKVELNKFDQYMRNFFSPDEDARTRARKDKVKT